MKCVFCGTNIPKGTGMLHAYKDGTIYSFCSRKCETNQLKLKRKPQKVKWTARYHEEKQIRIHGKEKKKVVVKKETKKKTTRAERKTKREAKKAEKKKQKKKEAK